MSSDDDLHTEYRLVLMGAGGAGKSCLTNMFLTGFFTDDYDPTIEDSYIKKTQVDDEIAVLDILDTAGQEEYSAMLDDYMRNGQGFVCVYSVTDKESFKDVRKFREKLWAVKDRDTSLTLPFMLVGNKVDMEDQRQVTTSEGQALAQEFKCGFIETSAKTGLNVHDVFHGIVRQVRKDRAERGYQLGKSRGPDEKMKKKISSKFAKWGIMKSAKAGIARMSKTMSSAFKKKEKIPQKAASTPVVATNSHPATNGSTSTSSVHPTSATPSTATPSTATPNPPHSSTGVQQDPTPPRPQETSVGSSAAPSINSRPLEEIESDLQSWMEEIHTPASPSQPQEKIITPPNPTEEARPTSSTLYGKIPKLKASPESTFEQCPYFYPNISGSDVPKLLSGKAVGTFLIRYSSQPKHVAVSYVCDGEIQSVLVGFDDDSVWMTEDGQGQKYATLNELIVDYDDTLKHPLLETTVPVDNKHYTKIPTIPGVTANKP